MCRNNKIKARRWNRTQSNVNEYLIHIKKKHRNLAQQLHVENNIDNKGRGGGGESSVWQQIGNKHFDWARLQQHKKRYKKMIQSVWKRATNKLVIIDRW